MQHFGDPDSPGLTRLGRLLQHMRESKVRFNVSDGTTVSVADETIKTAVAALRLSLMLSFLAFTDK